MKFFILAALFFLIAGTSYSQSELLERAKFGMTQEEVLTTFKDDGITPNRVTVSDEDMKSDYRLPSYQVGNLDYTIFFYTKDYILKGVKFSLNKGTAKTAQECFDSWIPILKEKYGDITTSKSSGVINKSIEHIWISSGMKISLYYSEMEIAKEKNYFCEVFFTKAN